MKVWDVEKVLQGEVGLVSPLPANHERTVDSVAFSRDGKLLASASWDRTIKFWDSTTWKLLHDLPDPTGAVLCLISAGPIAVPDEYRMLSRTRLTISIPQGVLSNDLGAAGRPAQARLVQGPHHGRLVLRPDGTFRYVPTAGFQGSTESRLPRFSLIPEPAPPGRCPDK